MRARKWEGVGAAVVQAACGEDVTGEWMQGHARSALKTCRTCR